MRLAHAELRVEATRAGIDLPDGFVELLDLSKLLGEDGEPSADAIGLALQPFQELKKPKFIQNLGLGRQGPSYAPAAHVSLDARERH
ncbi:Hypothetical protein SCLAV_2149 [Streptomyces clavuligerus]|uniref:Uncharacterized protein n=1 Tax=Streptomyces clavuligerus TaxID=1901 RepID=E2Q698_STRCL|nr:Hypothetical protein SCLAV_2149 [Streptomyces clavuligerus]